MSLLHKAVCGQLWVSKATRTVRKTLVLISISPALIKKRFIVDLICPLHGYHGRSLGSALLGGNARCWHQRNRMEELTCAGHRGCIIVGSEKASVTGARRGSFPDWVAVGWALGTGSIRGEGLVISDFAGYGKDGEKTKTIKPLLTEECKMSSPWFRRRETFLLTARDHLASEAGKATKSIS